MTFLSGTRFLGFSHRKSCGKEVQTDLPQPFLYRQYLYVCYYFCPWWRHVLIHPPMNCRAFLWQKPFCVFTLSANQCLLANLFIKADLCWWQDQEHQTSIHLLGRSLPGDCVEGARRGILFYNKRKVWDRFRYFFTRDLISIVGTLQ